MVERLRRVRDWWVAHPQAGDALLVLLLVPLFLASAPSIPAGMPEALFWLLLALWVLPMLVRRTHPQWCAGLVAAAHVLQLMTVHEPLPGNIGAPMVVYAVARYGRGSFWHRFYLGLGLAGALAAGVDWTLHADGPTRESPASTVIAIVVTTFGVGVTVVAAWGLGMLGRQRAITLETLRERAAALERERDQHARLAAQQERARIAREMHDVVAHSLSVIVVQADGAAYAAEHGPDPAAARDLAAQALATIGGTAREALAETRRLVAVLRDQDAELELAPRAGLAEIDGLIAPLREAGRRVEVQVHGTPGALPPGAEAAAYRVVQEALTNVIKHAGPHAAATVVLDHRPDALAITVTDDGRGAAAACDGHGNGLIGMRERMSTYGGSLQAGPRAGGGFTVTALLPFDAAAVPADPTTPIRAHRDEGPQP